MKLPRLSIAKLMVIVGVVALNIAATRAFIEWEWTGLFLIGLALQVGLLCLIRSRIGFRPFWWGFEAFGLASVITPIFITLISPDAGSELLRLIALYVGSAFNLVDHLCTLLKNPVSQARLTMFLLEDMQLIIIEIAIFLPQLLIAVVGGLLVSLIVRWWGKAPAGCLTKLSSPADHAGSISVSNRVPARGADADKVETVVFKASKVGPCADRRPRVDHRGSVETLSVVHLIPQGGS